MTEQVVEGIELTEGEDYLKLEGGGVRCLGCLNRCILQRGKGVSADKEKTGAGGCIWRRLRRSP